MHRWWGIRKANCCGCICHWSPQWWQHCWGPSTNLKIWYSRVHSGSSPAGLFSCSFIHCIKHSCISRTKIASPLVQSPSKGAVKLTGRGRGRNLCLFQIICLFHSIFLSSRSSSIFFGKVVRTWKICRGKGFWWRRDRAERVMLELELSADPDCTRLQLRLGSVMVLHRNTC